MFKKTINYILLCLIILSFIVICYGIYNVNSANKLVEKISIKVEKIVEDKPKVRKKAKDNSLKNAIGLIIFKSNKKIAIFNNPTDYNLKLGVGKIVNNSELNKYGNNILLGHRDSSFRELKDLNIDDIFEIKTKNNVKKYKIIKIYVTSKDDPIPYQDSKDLQVTLVTCYPFVYLGNAPKRYVVIAEAI